MLHLLEPPYIITLMCNSWTWAGSNFHGPALMCDCHALPKRNARKYRTTLDEHRTRKGSSIVY